MRIKTSSREQSLQSTEQTSLSTQRQAIYLNKNLHTPLLSPLEHILCHQEFHGY